ncbi:efflux RND transporter periplasmic adaptor subunit [candidate division KSB1 bacterium]|nr:efflux RND transporter periplasmic adaptor subunit [candidate division KSB1 bacterium]NIR72857.1 efflux RND transporter periplasmic adaptor subunit [candidate division KSB1 bacterium]NIS23756.1 efflux RND transporter periplasmic adaptor subunit [candidate division KSB1 bacterium]NIT70677.1 efflux RND transporter periplasmic adaptor subunit [candidate division KSB1 bacterium]NIU24406.1 efflux RND transporter periplasmic adaptor subunit [candidate division KSB1 bacterium]
MLIKLSDKSKSGLRAFGLFTMTLFIFMYLFTACGNNEAEQTVSGDKQLWTCGMHPQVVVDEPGNCPICGMKLTPLKSEATARADTPSDRTEEEHDEMMEELGVAKEDKKILYWRAPMDPTYISDKPGKSPMGMDLVPVYEGEGPPAGSAITIDPVTVQNMGVRTAEVKRQPFYRIIRTVGHIDYNEEKLYNINLKFSGWIERLYVDRTGDPVRKGQPLLKIYSPDLVATQEEYLLAYKNHQKVAESAFEEVSGGAGRLLEAARQRLKYWDITPEQIEELEKSGTIQKTLTIYSPADGIVIHKNAVEGAYAREGMDLFRIADLSTVWVLAHIFEYELPWVKVGQMVKMELPYIPGKVFRGRVDYIYPFLHAKTRDIRIRLVFENPTLQLKPEMYANITIESRVGDNELVIPSEAVIRTGTRNLVFIDLGNGRFRPQEVVLGPEGEKGLVEVVAGLEEGQRIVTSAQFLLDSESRLREAIQKMLGTRSPVSGKGDD